MPRLSHTKILKGQAVAALVNLYRWDQEFARELDEIRDPYLDLIIQFALSSFESGRGLRLSTKDDWKTEIKSASTESTKNIWPELQPYCKTLDRLAYKWKLRAPWAVMILMLYDMNDVLRIKGLIANEMDIPLELYELMYPWEAPLPSLEVTVPAWALILEGREKVMAMIRKKLQNYESQLKASGLKEHPSSIEKHAKWWFEHHIHGKKYDDIAQGETHSPGGSCISYARNVGRAVRKFSILVGISLKDLKK